MAARTPFAAAVLTAALLFRPGAALAHKVNVFAVAEAGALTGEGYFANGSKAQACPVELRDASGRVAATARTGKDGSFRLELPPGLTPPLTLVLKAGDGHQADYTLTAADLGPVSSPPDGPGRAPAVAPGGVAGPQAVAPPGAAASGGAAMSAAAEPGRMHTAPAASAQAASPPGSAAAPATPALPLDEARLQALVERAAAKAVEEKLAPLRLELARLAAQAEGNRVRDIAGGLGWIAGLVGLAAWFKRRR
ncbi:hypothetical protein NNJEOMEG_00683 [Fundidesulfovibrio magnetotacticus]|uniref:Nickel transport protein n=1 Tax=Fundidesulfovibrio magnetotacticus TaxID=2730080 RepID=A0A6V8LX46_9BACT|nr:hypothetical protein [Fundidesulfovibrio magnetotacticus]GFK92855.1 hypothetical protein NNJEOMEG_00683 [Fundidesulfovibrio magnetotacticus]